MEQKSLNSRNIVELDEYELFHAATAGVQRRISSLKKNRPQLYGADERRNYWEIDIIGMMGEYAVSKYLNIHWQPATNKRLADLPGDVGRYEVRSSTWPDAHLLVREADKDKSPYILAIVHESSVDLRGFKFGVDAKQPEYHRERQTYWVPQADLEPMAMLPFLLG